MLFGGLRGISLFDPNQTQSNAYRAPTYITELNIYNELAMPGDEGSPLEQDILLTDTLTLTHKQPVFSLAFSSLNYRVHEDNTYAYYLEGFDKEFLPATTKNRVSYTNLDPGHYTFHVRAFNNSGIASDQTAQLNIIVKPSPWRSPMAYGAYFLLIASVILGYIYMLMRKIKFERNVNQRLRQLDDIKDEIMTNTTHELRTPLNGIIGLTEYMRSSGDPRYNQEDKENLDMIIASGKRLANLVNDILDFAKIRNAELKLNLESIDLHDVVQLAVLQVSPLIEKSQLVFHNQVPANIGHVWIDNERTQQILVNLLGNAIKFTREGSITIGAVTTEKMNQTLRE